MIIQINPNNPEPEKINQAIEILKQGGVIAYPTDTVYAIAGDILNKKTVEKINQIKKRDKKKPLSIVCEDLQQVSQFAYIQDYAYRLMKKVLPGPYTFVLKAKNPIPQQFISKQKTVGIRIPDHPVSAALVAGLGNPITTTSLNISGQDIFSDPKQVDKEMANKFDLIIDSGVLPQEASTVIDLSGRAPVILREGKGDPSLFI